MANFEGLNFKNTGVSNAKKESGLNEYASSLFDPSVTWRDLKWLRSVTKLPIIIKGVLSGEDLKCKQENYINKSECVYVCS